VGVARRVRWGDDLADMLSPVALAKPFFWDELEPEQQVRAWKETAPIIGFYTLAPGNKRSDDAVESCCALAFDIDRVDDPDDIEHAIEALPWALAYWTTWQSTPWSPRYRLVVPTAQDVTPEHWAEVYSLAKAVIESRLGVKVDACGEHPSQPWFLPSYPEEPGCPAWGEVIPQPVVNDGELWDLQPLWDQVVENRRRRQKRSKARGGRIRKQRSLARAASSAVASPFMPMVDAGSLVTEWDEATALTTALNRIEWLRVNGIHTSRGNRQPELNRALWHLYRSGEDAEHLAQAGDAIVAASASRDRAYLGKQLTKGLRHYERKIDKAQPTVDRLWAVLRPLSWEGYQDATLHLCTILGRARHLQDDRGGSLSWDEISAVVGIPRKACCWLRQRLADVGLLTWEGSGRARRYLLHINKETTP
jgi:hypothetical protein